MDFYKYLVVVTSNLEIKIGPYSESSTASLETSSSRSSSTCAAIFVKNQKSPWKDWRQNIKYRIGQFIYFNQMIVMILYGMLSV